VKAASLAEGQELADQEFPALLDRGGGEVPDGGFVEELGDRLGDGRDLRLEDANLAGGLPLMHDRGGGGPIGGVETASDRLAADRPLDPDRTVAAGPVVAFRDVGTGAEVSPVERETALRHGPIVSCPSYLAYELCTPIQAFDRFYSFCCA